MIKNGKIPTYIFVGLIVVLFIVSFNYWKLMEKNDMFKKSLYANEDKLNELIEKKVQVEKQIEVKSPQKKLFIKD